MDKKTRKAFENLRAATQAQLAYAQLAAKQSRTSAHPPKPPKPPPKRPKVAWHVSPMVNRESIREQGLRSPHPDRGYPGGETPVWLMTSKKVAKEMSRIGWKGYESIDVWEVECTGIEVLNSAGQYGYEQDCFAWLAFEVIPPESLTLIVQAPPEPERETEYVDVTSFGSLYRQTVPVAYAQMATGMAQMTNATTATSNHYTTFTQAWVAASEAEEGDGDVAPEPPF